MIGRILHQPERARSELVLAWISHRKTRFSAEIVTRGTLATCFRTLRPPSVLSSPTVSATHVGHPVGTGSAQIRRSIDPKQPPSQMVLCQQERVVHRQNRRGTPPRYV